MPSRQRRNYLWIEPRPIVEDPQPTLIFLKLHVELDTAGPPMSHGVINGLANDHQEVMNRFLLKIECSSHNAALDRNSKFLGHFFCHLSQQRSQTRSRGRRLAQIPDCLASFINGRAQLRSSAAHEVLLGVGFPMSQTQVSFQQRGNANASLDERVVHLSCQAVSLTEHCLKPRSELAQAETMDTPDNPSDRKYAQSEKPCSSVEVWPL